MAKFSVGCTLKYQLPDASTFVMNVAAARTAHQQIEQERFEITPAGPVEEHVEPTTGNRYHRFAAESQAVSLHYAAMVTYTPRLADVTTLTVAPPDRLPLWILPYLLPSRYCQSDHLMRLAYREFGGLPPGYQQVRAICEWIYRNVDYLVGMTGPLTSAFDVATSRVGVCRDFAHLGIALCRAVNIPARFVSGYAYQLSPPDFHAMFEVWLGDGWYLFDPTWQVLPQHMLRIGTGRDATDVSFGLIFGAAMMTSMEIHAHALDTDDAVQPIDVAVAAI
ncbi:transglutaminase family protein [Phycisphaerales bacterium AB-hyl4]|uniref:Transglutaminase family protein n=1 Tax=Natronomicrosphaera hydrolytica TaxID=3242702 RepID=A0ABV4U3A2_9BACT